MPRRVDDKSKKVTIAYRDDGRGQGALWDHQTIMNSEGVQTYATHNGDMAVDEFNALLQRTSFFMKEKPTLLHANDYGQGLLLLPGESRKTAIKRPADLAKRKQYEYLLVKDALRRGRPILAICGGGYHLQEFLGGRLVEIKGHDTGAVNKACDLALDADGCVVGNIAAHRVSIKPDSLLASMLKPRDSLEIATNSIHGLVVDDADRDVLQTRSDVYGACQTAHQYINARADVDLSDEDIDLLKPEGFEPFYHLQGKPAYAAPVLATQWHLEAYATGESRQIIDAMIEAGHSFDKKQAVLDELKADYAQIKDSLRQVSFFRPAVRDEVTAALDCKVVNRVIKQV